GGRSERAVTASRRARVLRDLLLHDGPARHSRAHRHRCLDLALVPREQGHLRTDVLRPHRLRGALLAPRRSHLDLPLPAALPDPLVRIADPAWPRPARGATARRRPNHAETDFLPD